MGVAIAGMHYTGMAAAHFTPRPGAASIEPQHVVASSGLTGAVVAATLLILGIAVVGSLVDHALRRRAADAASLARLAAIVESSSDAIDSKSLDGTVQSWNAAAERLYGYTTAEIVGRPVTVLVPPGRVAETTELLARIGRGDQVENLETVRLRRDGSPVHVSLTLLPITDTAGRVTGVSSITRDISERKRSDAALRESQERYELVARDELRRLGLGPDDERHLLERRDPDRARLCGGRRRLRRGVVARPPARGRRLARRPRCAARAPARRRE